MKNPLHDSYKLIRSDGKVLDIGCLGFHQVKIAHELGCNALVHYGVDYVEPDEPLPIGFTFKMVDLNKEEIPFEDDFFDLVIARHVIEHVSNPIVFFGECVRVCKPGGIIYFEAPSERSLFLPGMPFDHHKFFSTSFYDDPTHYSRPWSPQSFFRLSKYFSCDPVRTGYITSLRHRILFPLAILYARITRNGQMFESYCWLAFGWASYIIVRKNENQKGKPKFTYYIPQNR
jgi:SAM-dependent methyltransferase